MSAHSESRHYIVVSGTDSSTGRFTPEKRAQPRPLDKKLGGPNSRSEHSGGVKNSLCPCRESNSISQPVA
jgi:hypothetical protein